MIQHRGDQAMDELRRAAASSAVQAGARLVVLFGSTARGEPHAQDLDIGILSSEPLDAVELTNLLTRRLHTQAVDVTELRGADPVLLALAARDGVPLFEREPGEFAQFVSVAVRRFADTRKFREAQAASLGTVADDGRQSR